MVLKRIFKLLLILVMVANNTSIYVYAQSKKEIQAEDALIPREVLFGNPDKTSVKISSDGKYISYLAPQDGVLNVFIAPVSDPLAAKPVTNDKERGIRSYFWAVNSNNIIYAVDEKGDENFRLYSVDINTLKTQLLTPKEGVKALILKSSLKFPDEILIKTNERVPEYFDVYRVNVKTGAKELVLENKNQYISFEIDEDLKIRLAYKMPPDGGLELYSLGGDGGYTPELFQKIQQEDMLTTYSVVISTDGNLLYMVDSSNRDKSALYEINLSNKQRKLIYEDSRADIESYLINPVNKKVEAVKIDYLAKEWMVLDQRVKEDMDYLVKLENGDLQTISRTAKDDRWIVEYIPVDGSNRYYLYDRVNKKAKFLFVSNSQQEQYKFAKMYPVKITARDGLELVSYLTLPRWLDQGGKLDKPIPLILKVHGGPNYRDSKGYNAEHQWLANRGYAVLSVNYRGSTGFGKSFINAGDGQWARKMQDDLEDGVKWAIDNKIAEKDKVVIMGGSYGGYATLVGMTMTPDLYAAGIDIVGMSSLETFVKSVPPYWKPVFAHIKKMLGVSPDDEEGRKILAERSPLNYAQNIKKPLLIAQGANDPRVKQAESEQIVTAMKNHGLPVVYLLYPDEGHGFAKPENKLSFYANAEIFLANILKGRYIPHNGNFPGSSVKVMEGRELTWTVKVDDTAN